MNDALSPVWEYVAVRAIVPAKPLRLLRVIVVVFPLEPCITPNEVGLALTLKPGELTVTEMVVV